jgi:hypothetical protein
MLNLACYALTFLFLVTAAPAAFAQIDKAKAGPLADFTKYYKETVNFAEKNQRDSALWHSEKAARPESTRTGR